MPAAHRSADRSLVYPSLARSAVGALVAIAVILCVILGINLLTRDHASSIVPAARKSTTSTSPTGESSSSASTPASDASEAATATATTAAAKPRPGVKATGTPAPAAATAVADTASASAAAPVALPTKAQAAALRLPLTVLNNSRIRGLAATAAADFRAAGWPVGDSNIAGTTYQPKVTTVYFLPGQEASASQLMRDIPRVRRMLPRPQTLPGHGLTVVVTREYVE